MRSCRKYNKNRNNNFLKAIKLKISCKQTFYVNSLIFAEKKIAVSQDPSEEAERCIYPHNQGRGSGVATAFDLGAFRLSMIVPVKKPVNHSRTVVSMHETGHERVERDVCLRGVSTVQSEVPFGRFCQYYNHFYRGNMELTSPLLFMRRSLREERDQ